MGLRRISVTIEMIPGGFEGDRHKSSVVSKQHFLGFTREWWTFAQRFKDNTTCLYDLYVAASCTYDTAHAPMPH